MSNSTKYPRPLSPHLQVYRLQLTSATSILHRLTGMILMGSCFLLTGWLIVLAMGLGPYTIFMEYLTSWWGKTLLWIIVASLYYHLANGIRHLLWDAGYGFKLPDVYRSGWIVLGFTLMMTGITWLFSRGGL